MSQRTSQANIAIRRAWINEKELVSEGKGTRQWTPEQQQSILDKGKAYDENGKAFIGHHMKSAERFPEFQDNPQVIQFLSFPEHLDAHKGNWRTLTNWYYNPETRQYNEFEEDTFEPCKVINLSDPISGIKTEVIIDYHHENDEVLKPESAKKAVSHVKTPVKPAEGNNKAKRLLTKHVQPALKKAAVYVIDNPETVVRVVNVVVRGAGIVAPLFGHAVRKRSGRIAIKGKTANPGPVTKATPVSRPISTPPVSTGTPHSHHKTPAQHPVTDYPRFRYGKWEHVRAHISPRPKE